MASCDGHLRVTNEPCKTTLLISSAIFQFWKRSPLFLKVLETGGAATNVFLRRIHNFALDMAWLPWPILPKKRWPTLSFKEKRAITLAEHQAILQRERNPEWRSFYEILWHIGGGQTDVANLRAEDMDWKQHVLSYRRKKTGTMCHISFGEEVAAIVRFRPASGLLFPTLAPKEEKHRAKEFQRRCDGLEIKGVSLHSYPLRMGGTCAKGGLSRAIRARGARTQQQSGSSRLR